MPRECGLRVEKGSIAYPCTVMISDGAPAHRGPCAAMEAPASVRAREKWQAAQDEAHRLAEDDLRAVSGGVPRGLEDKFEERKPHPEEQRRIDREARIRAQVEREEAEDAANEAAIEAHQDVATPDNPDGVWLRPDAVHPHAAEADYRDRPFIQDVVREMTEPTKQREGDQPLPVRSDRPFIQDGVIADIEARKEVGVKRYGTALQAFNGRNVLQDWYEELIDATVYGKQLQVEASVMAAKARAVAETVMDSDWFKGLPEDRMSAMADAMGTYVGWLERLA